MFTKLRYAEDIDLNDTASGASSLGATTLVTDYIYRANGCFDPNTRVGGHQPRGFDELMSLYDHFVVVGAKMTCRITNASTVAPVGEPISLAIVVHDDNIEFNSYLDMMEHGYVKSSLVAHPEGSRATTTLSKGFSAKKFLGKTNVLDSDELKGSVNADPTEGAFFHIIASVPALSGAKDVRCQVVIDYIVALVEPKQPVAS